MVLLPSIVLPSIVTVLYARIIFCGYTLNDLLFMINVEIEDSCVYNCKLNKLCKPLKLKSQIPYGQHEQQEEHRARQLHGIGPAIKLLTHTLLQQ